MSTSDNHNPSIIGDTQILESHDHVAMMPSAPKRKCHILIYKSCNCYPNLMALAHPELEIWRFVEVTGGISAKGVPTVQI